jgi:hypothetical protein
VEASRGILQPLLERVTLSDAATLTEAMRLADPSSGNVVDQDPILGVAAQASASSSQQPVRGAYSYCPSGPALSGSPSPRMR